MQREKDFGNFYPDLGKFDLRFRSSDLGLDYTSQGLKLNRYGYFENEVLTGNFKRENFGFGTRSQFQGLILHEDKLGAYVVENETDFFRGEYQGLIILPQKELDEHTLQRISENSLNWRGLKDKGIEARLTIF